MVAIGVGMVVFVLISVGAVFVGVRYWLIARRMRRQALATASGLCARSFAELQATDREGLLVC